MEFVIGVLIVPAAAAFSNTIFLLQVRHFHQANLLMNFFQALKVGQAMKPDFHQPRTVAIRLAPQIMVGSSLMLWTVLVLLSRRLIQWFIASKLI